MSTRIFSGLFLNTERHELQKMGAEKATRTQSPFTKTQEKYSVKHKLSLNAAE